MFFYGNIVVFCKLYPAVEIIATTFGINMDYFQMFLKFNNIHVVMMMIPAMFA